MARITFLTFLALYPAAGWAKPFDRPMPNAQSATAELWFAIASLALVIALYAVHRLVKVR